MKSDIDIAKDCAMRPIEGVATQLGLQSDDIELYGTYKAKVKLSAYEARKDLKEGKLILVTTTTPTPFGEGKTTTTIGLAQGLGKIGKKSIVCIREPSLGPTMGVKGGAAGGGYSQVLPMEDINLHFTGDMYMVGATHNLLASMIDNHIYFGNSLCIDPNNITWNRVMDMNDRALRDLTIRYKGTERTARFDITAASEVMAILCLSTSFPELINKLGAISVGFTTEGKSISSKDLKADGAMAALLKEAIKPNLVQTIEGVPAFVHGGPFANIAHGCNSLIATKLALKLGDYVVTEAGFGSDLGAEKFFDIKCRAGGLSPSAVVLVITTKALKWHGGATKETWKEQNEQALCSGMSNLERHISGLKTYGVPLIVAINKYDFDSQIELDLILNKCLELGVPAEISDVHANGGNGGIKIAEAVVNACNTNNDSGCHFTYDLDDDIEMKIEKIAKIIYGASGVVFTDVARKDLEMIKSMGHNDKPVCMAKTQFSFSDDHKKTNAPTDFVITIKSLKAAAGAGYVIAYAGDIMTMPGLPQHPAAENISIDEKGQIHGIF